MAQHTFYRSVKVDGLSIFYREAGPKDAPTLLLLHGLPSSSRMFEPLYSRLSNEFHLIAPDYPGLARSQLENSAGILGRPNFERGRSAEELAVSRNHPYAAHRK
jgi:pimeloyl-ACP methyl ester carboxylesterase